MLFVLLGFVHHDAQGEHAVLAPDHADQAPHGDRSKLPQQKPRIPDALHREDISRLVIGKAQSHATVRSPGLAPEVTTVRPLTRLSGTCGCGCVAEAVKAA